MVGLSVLNGDMFCSRAGSTDFQQLRDIWEAHHSVVTPDGELPPSSLLHPSLLSRSQTSLTAELSFNDTKSSSLDNIMVGVTVVFAAISTIGWLNVCQSLSLVNVLCPSLSLVNAMI